MLAADAFGAAQIHGDYTDSPNTWQWPAAHCA